MNSRHGETLSDSELVAVQKAFWERGGFEDLGGSAVIMLSYLAHRGAAKPESLNTLSKKLRIRWSTVKSVLDALTDSGYVSVTKTSKGPLIRVMEPHWLNDTPEAHAP